MWDLTPHSPGLPLHGGRTSMDVDESSEGFSQSPQSRLTYPEHSLSPHLDSHPFIPDPPPLSSLLRFLPLNEKSVVSPSPSLATKTSVYHFATEQTILHPLTKQSDTFLDQQITVTSTLQAPVFMEMSYSPTNRSSELDFSMSAVSYESVSVSAASTTKPREHKDGLRQRIQILNPQAWDTTLSSSSPPLISTTPMPSLHLEPARVSDRSLAPDSTNPSSPASEPFPTSPSKSTSTPRTTFHPEQSENSRTSSDSRSSLSQPQQQQTPAPPVTHGGSGGRGCGDREALVSGLTCRRCSKEPPSPASLPWSGYSTGLGDSDGPPPHTGAQELGGCHLRCQVCPVASDSRFDSDAHRPTLAGYTPRLTHTGNDIIGALWCDITPRY
ncbi:soluble scavenger receptor cysteine-rich domain-containing protein SSC5D-like [Gadus macrocephalus]|uniref:soluble scavenger receptor cysteine-rich domain-containing protein SSC5D-like n=1 Tax=Gadus macrocephalus TaxID=80720 RepID=UPI0028CB6D74|nr:soluble scavenger receptor cysteine-rich domain-containing protein SSC5D-like [Gadus macrocephalus]